MWWCHLQAGALIRLPGGTEALQGILITYIYFLQLLGARVLFGMEATRKRVFDR